MPLDLAHLTRRLSSSYQPSGAQPYSLEASFQTVLEAEQKIYGICERAGIVLEEDALPLRENTLPLKEEKHTLIFIRKAGEKVIRLVPYIGRGAVSYTAGGYVLEVSHGNYTLAVAATAIATLGICAVEELGRRAISHLLPQLHPNI